MDGFFEICALAIIGVVSSLILTRFEGGVAFAVKLCTVIIIMGVLAISLKSIISELEDTVSGIGQVSEYAQVVLKALGIAMIAHISSRICRDCGAEGIAGAVELAAKIEIFILCLPLIRKIIESATEILNMG